MSATDWTWQDLEREAPEIAKHIAFWVKHEGNRDTLVAAIGRLVAQREARIVELEAEVKRLKARLPTFTVKNTKVDLAAENSRLMAEVHRLRQRGRDD